MRIAVLLVPLSLLGCDEVIGRGPDAGGPAPPTGHPVNGPIESPPGFFHLPNGTKATTLYLQPDGEARMWLEECDSIVLADWAWQSTSGSTVELDGGTSLHVLTYQDEGTALIEPPLVPQPGVSQEIWQPGATCSVCMPGHPLAVVGCATPDAGPVAQCCSGGCGGAVAFDPACTYSLVAGGLENAASAGNCVCPVGTVAASDCTAYPKVFCGGL